MVLAMASLCSCHVHTISSRVELSDPHVKRDVPCNPYPIREGRGGCFPGNSGGECFRIVMDNFLDDSTATAIINRKERATRENMHFSIVEEFPGVIGKVKHAIQSASQNSSLDVRLDHFRVDIGSPSSYGYTTCHLHSDFQASVSYVYTAVIYLSTEGIEFEGGETVFVDRLAQGVDARGILTSGGLDAVDAGDVVEPRKGRAVLFSGGLENMHCRMPVFDGTRSVLQLWWDCAQKFVKG